MSNELQVIIEKSGLEPVKAKAMLQKFEGYVSLAEEWAKKAKAIVVTSADQKEDIERAKEGRKILQEKRITLEKARKEYKQQALNEGRAIDSIASALKRLIAPIEEHLYKQENFVKILEEEKREKKRQEVEARIAEEEAAEEEKERKKNEKIRRENVKFKKEAEVREEKEKKERDKVNADKKAVEDKNRKEREALEEKNRVEREKLEEKARKDKAKAKEKTEKERKEKERLEELLKNEVSCPKCGHKFQRKEIKK